MLRTTFPGQNKLYLVKPVIYGHIGSSRVNEMDKGEEAMVQKKLQQKIYVKLETEKMFCWEKAA